MGIFLRGGDTSTGLTLSPDTYEGGIRDITILPGMWGDKGESLTRGEQFALRSEMAELMRAARIARPDALYGASNSAQTLEGEERVIINPIDSDEIADVGISNATSDIRFPHIE